MKLLLTTTLIFIIQPLILTGQDTTFYNTRGKKTENLDSAHYYEIILREPADSNKVSMVSYYKTGQIKADKRFSDFKKSILEGKDREWYENGKPRKEADYVNDKLHGSFRTWWENGQLKRDDKYETGKFIEGKCFDSTGIGVAYYDYEKMPEFPGGENALVKFLSSEIKYPKDSRKKGISGTIFVSFVVNEEGDVTDIKILRGVNDELNNEAIRVINMMPKWEPGLQDGTPVKVQYNLPLRFSLY